MRDFSGWFKDASLLRLVFARRHPWRQPIARSRLAFERCEGRCMLSGSPADDHGNTIADASSIGPVLDTQTTIEGMIGSPTDVDMFSLTASAGDILRIATRRPPGKPVVETALRLFDQTGNLVVAADGADDGYAILDAVVIPNAGTYFIGVSAPPNTLYNPIDGTGVEPGISGGYLVEVRREGFREPGGPQSETTDGSVSPIFSPPFIGLRPSAVVARDFNGDGVVDIALTSFEQGQVSVLKGLVDGTFTTFGPFVSVGAGPLSMVGEDLNADGHVDLVVANFGTSPASPGSTVSVLFGNGDGTFQEAVVLHVGQGPSAVAVADVHGDGRIDILVTNFFSGTFSVLAGLGSKSFAAAESFAAGGSPTAIAVADLDGDGRVDVVVADSGQLSGAGGVLLVPGVANGLFGAPRTLLSSGRGMSGVAIARLNGDERPDIVAVNALSSRVHVLLNDGAQGFSAEPPLSVDAGPVGVTVDDVNRDGRADIITVNKTTSTVSVLLGLGNGAFAVGSPLPVGSGPLALAVADINGDSHLDLITANFGTPGRAGSTMSTLIGDGTGSFVLKGGVFGNVVNSILTLTYTYAQAVRVIGRPVWRVAVGPDIVDAVYDPGQSSATSLVFTYVIGNGIAGEVDVAGVLSLPGSADIRDDATDQPAGLTVAAKPDISPIRDETPPQAMLLSYPDEGAYTLGDELIFQVRFDERVTFGESGGTPRIKLVVGLLERVALFQFLTGGGRTAVFRYVADATTDGRGIDIPPGPADALGLPLAAGVLLDGTQVRDRSGNQISGSPPVPSFGPLIGVATIHRTDVRVDATLPPPDTTPPGVTIIDNVAGVASGPVTFTFTFTEPVTGFTAAKISVTGGSKGAFTEQSPSVYTLVVTPPAATTGTISVAIAAGAVADTAGNPSPAASAEQDFFLNGAPADIVLSGTSIPENEPAGTAVGMLSTSDPNVDDSFTYRLVDGAGDADNAAFRIEDNQLVANGSFNFELRDTYSIRVRSTDAGGLSVEKRFTITVTDVEEPLAVEAVVAAKAGAFRGGRTLSFTLVLSRPATVSGTPTLPLLLGRTPKSATFARGSGTNRLTFTYLVAARDNAPQVFVGNAFGFPRGSAIRAAGRRLAPTLPTGVAGALVPGVLIDTVVPRQIDRVTAPRNGTYTAGDTLRFAVNFSEAVFAATAPPVLGLTIGTGRAGARQAALVSGAGTSQLVFEYVVRPGDATARNQGIVIATVLAGGPLTDAAGNAASRTLSVPKTPRVRVDGVAAVAARAGIQLSSTSSRTRAAAAPEPTGPAIAFILGSSPRA
jgi:hypothetical protein